MFVVVATVKVFDLFYLFCSFDLSVFTGESRDSSICLCIYVFALFFLSIYSGFAVVATVVLVCLFIYFILCIYFIYLSLFLFTAGAR